jgi:hypothetical protein
LPSGHPDGNKVFLGPHGGPLIAWAINYSVRDLEVTYTEDRNSIDQNSYNYHLSKSYVWFNLDGTDDGFLEDGDESKRACSRNKHLGRKYKVVL